jgi:sugar phosphate permease
VTPPPRAATVPAFERAVYAKVTRRLLPFLFLCYILAYVDRVNVGFAKLQMQADLGLSDRAYGLGAGLFFIGYFFFEVPSNVLMRRVGARYWIARIMVLWGLISSSMMFARTETSFYALRLLLGVAEAGFFPGVILYLTFWYTRTHRARMVAAFMTAIPVAGVIGGPVSGWIMQQMSGVGGLRNWEWLYLLEGLPSILVGLLVLSYLDDGPTTATWLTADEKALLAQRLEEEESLKHGSGTAVHGIAAALRSSRVWLCAAIYFAIVMGNYGLTFWLPQIISETVSNDPWRVGLVSMIPWGAGAIAMVLVGRSSDRRGERRWHVAVPAMVGAIAFAASAMPGIGGWTGVWCLTIATAGTMACMACFWSLPTAFLSGAGAAAGIAWVNSLGNLSGYASPFLVGAIRDATRDATHPTGNMTLALLALAASLLSAGLMTIAATRPRRPGITAAPAPAARTAPVR